MLKTILPFLLRPFRKTADIKPLDFIANTKKDKKDNRDHLAVSSSLPTPYYTLIDNIPPIRSQGAIGSCASHAVMAAYEIQLFGNRYIEGSELFHYYNARKFINNTYPNDTGMTIRDACKSLADFGMALEMLWPYDVSKYNAEPDNLAYVFAKLYKVKEYVRLTTLDQIKEYLSRNIPVVCGIWLTDAFFKLSYDFDLYEPDSKGRYGHAVTIIGYDASLNEFIIRNSWGDGWGHNGYFRMPFDKFLKYSFDWWVVLI